jgi:ubiquinol-cytochrome c reductase cytochrome b subunit
MRRWLESRTGVGEALRSFLNEKVPSSVGWRNSLGSIAGALLLLQILTGFLLALYYVPHTEAALKSIRYVESDVFAGALVRALHYWGASFIVVALFCHVVRTFLSGAYRPPREVTWLVGLALLGVVISLAFTGQLLPWSQEGYWAANVGIEIASSAPVVGKYVEAMLLGGGKLGSLTLSRFYAVHVILLPLMVGGLVPLHLYLLRKHGPVRPARDTSDDTTPFFPIPFARDMVSISVVFIALTGVAWFVGGPDSHDLDLSDSSYVPRPEWYFLSHYELLRMFPGSMKIIGTFVIPTLLGATAALLPWIDRGKTNAWRDRKIVVACGLVLVTAIVGLTGVGLATAAAERGSKPEVQAAAVPDEESADPQHERIALGRRLFRSERCMKCHTVGGQGGTLGPDLSKTGIRLQENYLRQWLKNPQAFRPETGMPPVTLEGEDFDSLVAYLMTLGVDTP